MIRKATARKPAAKKTTAKPTAKKRITKSAAANNTTAKKRVTKRATTASKNLNGLSGRPSPATRQVAKAVKTAKKEGEKAAQKKLVKASKTKMDKVLKQSKEKINKLLKQSNERIAKILKGDKRKATAKTPRKSARSPFDLRRFRGARKKKETTKQRIERLSNEASTIRDQILLGIANGSLKFIWEDVKKETGFKDGERARMLTILREKKNGGKTIAKTAEKIFEDNDTGSRYCPSDDEIRDEIIDVLCTVNTPGDALKELDKGQGYGKQAPF